MASTSNRKCALRFLIASMSKFTIPNIAAGLFNGFHISMIRRLSNLQETERSRGYLLPMQLMQLDLGKGWVHLNCHCRVKSHYSLTSR
ncbi:hypothetical protein L226DRAFT_540308 [Lentinus tigrinus ALCF2SS1-7]|uniref:uncharacterized protein n=1 Tax=Lentinus tigrinus ALCF2SS1-7 TaxID=1328758 RepID=UPI0011662454|nr:hypothetical protein L226DRAFT_540308 [Lentinus tigrinus ALCF2SS1-7]